MNENIGLYRAFIDCINQNRNEVLDYYVTSVHNRGGRFLQEDRLILMVRGGTFIDALLENLSDQRMDRMSEYVTAHTNQLLASGYSIERVNIMYDLLEQSILLVANRKLQGQPGLPISVRSVKAVIQLARMVAVNIHLAKVSNTPDNYKGATLPNRSTAPRFGSTQFTPTETPRFQGATMFSYNKITNNRDLKPGYLLWPLQTIAGTTPAEYKAYLADGTFIQVLLADRLELYAPPNQSNSNNAACFIRQIGPITLAYPL